DFDKVEEQGGWEGRAGEGIDVGAQRPLVSRAACEVPEHAGVEHTLGFALVVTDVEQHHSGRRTCSVSASTATEPPSARTSWAATAAPRSRRSSPRTTGADAGVIGAIVSSGPVAVTSTSSTPPCRRAPWAWPVIAR